MSGDPISINSPGLSTVRFPGVRFTVRRLMVVIAALALGLGASVEAIRLKHQREQYLKLASENGQGEKLYRTLKRNQLSLAQIDESSAEFRWKTAQTTDSVRLP